MVVRPSQNLDTLTQAHPKGTTFWLAPGVHHLGRDEYDQVQPKAGNRYVGAPGAVLSGRHVSRIAFGGQAADVHLEFLTVEDFGRPGDNNNEGAVNHDGGTGWVFSHLTIKHNAGAGVLLGDDNVVEFSCLLENGQYGFSAFAEDGVQNLALRHNEIARNNTDDWEVRQPGCGCTGGGKFWDVRNASVTGNYVHENRGVGLWADMNNAGFLFRGNFISDNADEGLVYEVSYDAAVIGNTFVRNGITKDQLSAPSPPARYTFPSPEATRGWRRHIHRRFRWRTILSSTTGAELFCGRTPTDLRAPLPILRRITEPLSIPTSQ